VGNIIRLNRNNDELTERITVTLPSDVANQLKASAEERGVSVSKATRDAIELDMAIQSHVKEGAEIRIEYPNDPKKNSLIDVS